MPYTHTPVRDRRLPAPEHPPLPATPAGCRRVPWSGDTGRTTTRPAPKNLIAGVGPFSRGNVLTAWLPSGRHTMSLTHYDGQERTECPECGRSIRRKPKRVQTDSPISCGCGEVFDP